MLLIRISNYIVYIYIDMFVIISYINIDHVLLNLATVGQDSKKTMPLIFVLCGALYRNPGVGGNGVDPTLDLWKTKRTTRPGKP